MFAGQVAQRPSRIVDTAGRDQLGAYHEVTFDYRAPGARTGRIRAYDDRPVVLFSLQYAEPAERAEAFPILTTRPDLPLRLSYRSVPFSPYQFNSLADAADSPWLFFDQDARSYLLSAERNFPLARTTLGNDGSVAISLDPAAGALPAGFEQQAMLVFGSGINETYDTWGQALTELHGKVRSANDADVTLDRLGYWTDNGASYYYRYEPQLGYVGTLLAVRDDFARRGIRLGYLQLDSWWYPKGPGARWGDGQNGIFRYAADPELFPSGLSAFQQALGLPLVVHARWIDPASPLRSAYTTSGNVVTDPRYWDDRLAYLVSSGVVTYEQDWLGAQAQPRYNLTDPDAFLGNMARSAARNGLSMQYCMPLPRHYLQGATYANLTTIRVSDDRFERGKWDAALFDARLASALGAWPWTDVFMSTERQNLLLATLSAGVVGVGDALGSEDANNLRRAVRSDGVIVKPDVPLVPSDMTYVAEAQGQRPPMLATTYTQWEQLRALYVFAYAREGSQSVGFTSGWGAYVYEPARDVGSLLDAGQTFSTTVDSNGSYFVVAPVGPSGVAFLGDAERFVSLGRKRISRLVDDGQLHATVIFADGESSLVLHGYAPRAPLVVADGGGVEDLSYDATTGQFRFRLLAAPGAVSVSISLGQSEGLNGLRPPSLG